MISKNNHIDSLPPDVMQLLETEKTHYEMPEEIKQRIMNRVAGSLGISSAVIVAESGISNGVESGEFGVKEAGEHIFGSVEPSTVEVVTQTSGSMLSSLLKVKTVLAFVLGVGAGAGGYAVHDRIVSTDAALKQELKQQGSISDEADFVKKNELLSAPVRTDNPVSGSDTGKRALSADEENTHLKPVSKKERSIERNEVKVKKTDTRSVKEDDSSLQAERQLIEMARMALARGNNSDAVNVLHKHKTQFSDGALEEERDALLIQAVSAQQDRAKAEMMAKRFFEKYPRSVFRRVIERSLE